MRGMPKTERLELVSLGNAWEKSPASFLAFRRQPPLRSEDVTRIRHHPLVSNDIPIYGYIYDVKSGKLVEVPEATAAGKSI